MFLACASEAHTRLSCFSKTHRIESAQFPSLIGRKISVKGGLPMPEKREVYKCQLCGTIVEVLHAGSCVPSCCGQDLVHMEEGAVDAAKEKHVPVIEKIDGGYRVTVGSVAHPMVEKHFIQWIELLTENCVLRRELQPEEAPEATFLTDAQKVSARAYCNLHGLWKADC